MPSRHNGADSRGTLYITATPIGNLSDISYRAVNVLKDVDFIAAEDTRVTRKLLSHLEIKKPLVSYYKHNSTASGNKILARILGGESCALVSDAGTPGISDPGQELVSLCAENDVPMVIIPGACAAISALALSGFCTSRFTFEGFLSTENKKRLTHLDGLITEQRTMVFYEAPHKLLRTLKDMYDAFGSRTISVSRELTKIYEETLNMELPEAIVYFEENKPRGEFVIVVKGAEMAVDDTEDKLDSAIELAKSYIKSGLSKSEAVKKAADETGCSKNALYKAVVK